MSFLTWKTIRRRTWIEMPLPAEIIDFINRKALSSTSMTSDVEMRMGDIVGNDLTYMDETEVDSFQAAKIENEVENFGSIQPHDEEINNNENKENINRHR